MKTLIALIIAGAAALAAFGQQVTPFAPKTGTLTYTNAVPASTTDASNSDAVELLKDRGIAFVTEFTGNVEADANVTVTWQVSLNGTDWTTSSGITHALSSNGTNTVRIQKVIPPSTLDNLRYIRVDSVQNATTNAISGLAIKYSYFR